MPVPEPAAPSPAPIVSRLPRPVPVAAVDPAQASLFGTLEEPVPEP